MKKNKVHIIWGIVAIIALVGGFMYGKSTGAGVAGTGSFARGFASSTRGAFGGRAGAGGGFVTGTITAIDSSSITLQLANGNSEVVFYSSSTPVTEPTVVSVSKLATGAAVAVGGTANADGSMTATTIQVGGGIGVFRGAGGGGRNASGTGQ